MQEATIEPSSSHPSSEDEEVDSDDKLIQEVEGYIEANEAKAIACLHGAEDNLCNTKIRYPRGEVNRVLKISCKL